MLRVKRSSSISYASWASLCVPCLSEMQLYFSICRPINSVHCTMKKTTRKKLAELSDVRRPQNFNLHIFLRSRLNSTRCNEEKTKRHKEKFLLHFFVYEMHRAGACYLEHDVWVLLDDAVKSQPITRCKCNFASTFHDERKHRLATEFFDTFFLLSRWWAEEQTQRDINVRGERKIIKTKKSVSLKRQNKNFFTPCRGTYEKHDESKALLRHQSISNCLVDAWDNRCWNVSSMTLLTSRFWNDENNIVGENEAEKAIYRNCIQKRLVNVLSTIDASVSLKFRFCGWEWTQHKLKAKRVVECSLDNSSSPFVWSKQS